MVAQSTELSKHQYNFESYFVSSKQASGVGRMLYEEPRSPKFSPGHPPGPVAKIMLPVQVGSRVPSWSGN